MVMADSELNNGARNLSLVQPLTRSELEDEPVPGAESEPAPKRKPGRPTGSKNGEGKASKKGKTQAKAPETKASRAAKKKAAAKESKPQRLVRVRSAELQARGESGDADASKLLKSIQKAHGKWTGALEKKARVSTECGQRVKGAEAAFTNAIEAPLPVGVVELAAYREKLDACTVRWGEWSDAKAENIEEKKGARDDVKAALEALNEAIEDSRQQRLPGLN
jgi:hypothetical protein